MGARSRSIFAALLSAEPVGNEQGVRVALRVRVFFCAHRGSAETRPGEPFHERAVTRRGPEHRPSPHAERAGQRFDPGGLVPSVFQRGRGIVGKVAEAGEPLIFEDIRCDPRYERLTHSLASKKAEHNFLAVFPIKTKERALGAVACLGRLPRRLTEEELRLITSLLDQLAVAIDNIKLFEEVKSKTAELEESHRALIETLERQTAIAEVLRVMARSPKDLQPVLNAMIANAVRLARAKRGVIYIFNGEALRAEAHHNLSFTGMTIVREPINPDSETAVALAFRNRKAVHIPDVHVEPDFGGAALRTGMRTLLAVPMLLMEKPLGVIIIVRDFAEPFTQTQINLVTTFADQAVIAMETSIYFRSCKPAPVILLDRWRN